jgi:hypothetical protein
MSGARALPSPKLPADTSAEAAAIIADYCVSCGQPAGTPFCPHCGERRAADRRYSLLHFAREAAEAFASTDGKFLRTIWALVRAPGALTAAYMRGERVRYMGPVQVFLLMNLLFFVLASSSNTFSTPLRVHMNAVAHKDVARRAVGTRLAARGITLDQYRIAFDTATATQAKSLVIVMVPMFAMAVSLVHLRRRRYVLQHLVFSLHAFAALFLILLASALLVEIPLNLWARARGLELGWKVRDQVMTSAIVLAFGTYVMFALRRAYNDSRWVAIAKAGALCVGLAVVLFAYRFVLFFTTFWAT